MIGFFRSARVPQPHQFSQTLDFAAFAPSGSTAAPAGRALNFFLLAPPPAPSQRSSAEPQGARPGVHSLYRSRALAAPRTPCSLARWLEADLLAGG